MTKRMLLASSSAVVFSLMHFLGAGHAQAQDSNVYKVGILTNMSGPYSVMGWPGLVVVTKMAIEECMKVECKVMKIERLITDHQHKANMEPPRHANGSIAIRSMRLLT